MAYDKKQKKPKPLKVIAILAVAVPVVFLVVASNLGRTTFNLPQKLTLEALGSGQSFVNSLLASTTGVWQKYVDLLGVRAENERLRQEVKELKAKNLEYREETAENLSLSRLLKLGQSFELPTVTARIVGRDPSLWFETVIIDKGSSAGIVKGMPVVSVDGVIGQVVNLSPDYAKVLLAIDPNSAIDAISLHSRDKGIIKGNGTSYQMHYVLKNSDIAKDSIIITSGMGGVFPKGLAIGRVTSVVNTPRGMFQKITVEPSVDFRRLEYVTIILKEAPSFGDL